MQYSQEQLTAIYRRTSGRCHLCHKKLALTNYGIISTRGAWEVEHSRPRAKGGTDHMNNLYPACIRCNRSKGDGNTRAVRTQNGNRCAPLSDERRKQAKRGNAVAGGIIGALLGSVIGGPATLIGAVIGAHAGHKKNPDT